MIYGLEHSSFGLTPRSAIDLDPATTVLVGVRDRQVYKIDIGEEDTVNLVPTDGDFDGASCWSCSTTPREAP